MSREWLSAGSWYVGKGGYAWYILYTFNFGNEQWVAMKQVSDDPVWTRAIYCDDLEYIGTPAETFPLAQEGLRESLGVYE